MIRVKSTTGVKALASSLLAARKNKENIEMSCVGASSISQAIKAVITANKELSSEGTKFVVDPIFSKTVESPNIISITLRLSEI